MKSILIAGAVALSMGVVSAAPTCSGTSVFVNQSLDTGGFLNENGPVCSIDGFTFSNFFIYGQNLPTAFVSDFNFSLSNPSPDTLELDYSNLGSGDIQISYQISPGITGITLDGVTSQVTEYICGTPGSNTQPNNNAGCTPEINQSALSVGVGGTATSTVSSAATDFVFKDVLGGSENQQIIAPEPMTFSLMGIGLLGMGLVGRRLRRRR